MRDAIDMAREVYGAHTEWNEAQLERLNALVALVRADEREACVRRAEIALLGGAKVISDHVLDAIRARGETK
jgi:hypothetical protein